MNIYTFTVIIIIIIIIITCLDSRPNILWKKNICIIGLVTGSLKSSC